MAVLEPVLQALAHPVRREILWLVWQHELSVGEIVANFDLTGPSISSHLRVLRDVELVSLTKAGNVHLYRARRDRLAALEPYLRHPDPDRWQAHTDDKPDGIEVTTTDRRVTIVRCWIDRSPEHTFQFFVDADLLGCWLGTDATADARPGGRWGCITRGQTVRGIYSHYHPPSYLGLEWNFTDSNEIPIPKDPIVTAINFTHAPDNTTVIEIQQLSDSLETSNFFEIAWSDRLKQLQSLTDEP